MKKLVVVILVLSFSETTFAQFRAMTYNIRYDNRGDGANQWSNRKVWLAEQLLFHEPDILGIQEGLHHQVQFLDSTLSEYRYVGVGRDDGKTKGEYSAIFYKADRMKPLNEGTFWLSETPDKISVGWDASMERICTYALFETADGRKFWVFNTHFDHIGNVARENSAKLIMDQIKRFNGENLAVILMGDLNLTPETSPIQFLSREMEDAASVRASVHFGPEGTWNGFKHDSPLSRRIDYIFTSGVIQNKYAVISDSKSNRYPSDHLPVLIDFFLK